MKILIDQHTLERAEERGTNESEIKDVINTGFSIPAKYNRLAKTKIYPFQSQRHGKFYEQKKVATNLAILNNTLKSLPTSLFQREEKYFPLLTKGDAGGLDGLFQNAKVL